MTQRPQTSTPDPAAPSDRRSRGWQWLRAFIPAPMVLDSRERVRALAGGFIGIFLAAAASHWLSGASAMSAWLVAPLGASAVLVFAAPASPLAQPWSVVGGNTVSCLIGLGCAAWIPSPLVAAAAAVGLAIAVMTALRCLHPPGGAMALSGVLVHAAGGHFSLATAMTNSVLLVAVGIVYNSLAGRRYPHVQLRTTTPEPRTGSQFNAQDLDAVLSRYNQVLDVSRDDLGALLAGAELEGHRRRMGDVRCGDVMTRGVIAVEFGSTLLEAWELMRTHRVKALPVTDRVRRVIGIVTMVDFMRGTEVDGRLGFAASLRKFFLPDGLTHSEKPAVVGQIMTHHTTVAHRDRHAVDLLHLFTATGHHHIPVVDDENRIVGIVTQSDFLRFLNQRNYLAL